MDKKKNKEINLFSLILKDESSGLNVEGNNDIYWILKGVDSPIKSNKDEPELLIYVKFKGQVNLTKILIDSKAKEDDNKPDIVKLFANSSNMDFSFAESCPGTEDIKLEGKFNTKISLNLPKFRKISELVLFFNREEAEYIQLDSIQFYGTVADELFNVGDMKKRKEGKA